MYIHQQDWAAATRVAEQNDPAHVPDVLVAQAAPPPTLTLTLTLSPAPTLTLTLTVAQAAVCVQRQEFTKAEALYIRAKRPELAMQAPRPYLPYISPHLPYISHASPPHLAHISRASRRAGVPERVAVEGRDAHRQGVPAAQGAQPSPEPPPSP